MTQKKSAKAQHPKAQATAAKNRADVHIRAKAPHGAIESDLSANIDRFGSLVGKGMELAEAGLTLGVRMVRQLGSAGHETFVNRILGNITGAGGGGGQQSFGETPTARSAPSAGQPAAAEAPIIENRMAACPGSTVRVPFSLSNDSPDAQQTLRICVGQMTGTTTGALLPPESFSVSPSEVTIGPMDFEKCIITAVLPAAAAPDIYQGMVSIEGSAGFSIPFRLIISALQAGTRQD